MIQLAAIASSRSSPALRSPPADSAPAGDSEDDDIDLVLLQAGRIDRTHALIVAAHGLDLLRGLLRRGCLAATSLRPDAKPEAAAYELVLFPDITPDSPFERIIHDARRAMVPGGRLVVRVRRDPVGRTARGIARRLKLNGFIDVRLRLRPDCALLRADLPTPCTAGPSLPDHRPTTLAVLPVPGHPATSRPPAAAGTASHRRHS